ncbi:MAG: PstS family phosphate ABC transporter substrate-binding protein [Bacteroidia bacterium]
MKKLHYISRIFITGLLVAGILQSCSSPVDEGDENEAITDRSSAIDGSETQQKGEIYIAADETFRPIVETMVDVFENTYVEAKINVLYMPGEEAIQAMLSTDSIRLVICTRELERSERARLREQKTSPKVMELGQDAIALITHPSNPVKKLTAAQLRDVLSGKIARWNELDPQGADKAITLVFDNSQSSTVRFLKDNFMEGVQPKGYQQGDNPSVIQYVADPKNEAALGVIGLAWISDSDSQQATGFLEDINLLSLENEEDCPYNKKYGEFMQPYQGPIKAGCYRLTRDLYAIHRETRNGLGTGFAWWMISPETGQRIILKAGLVPAMNVTRKVQFPEKIP